MSQFTEEPSYLSYQTQETAKTISPRDSGSQYGRQQRPHEFKTYLLDGKPDKSWQEDKLYKAPRKSNWLIYIMIFLAIAVSGVVNWRTAAGVHKHDYCLVLDDTFSSIDSGTWTQLEQVDGFGTGAFDWTTADSTNSFTDSQGLHIVPTLTTETTDITEDELVDGFSLNLTSTDDGSGYGACTADPNSPAYGQMCGISSSSNGTTRRIINPVRSARLSTQGKKNITYGRVEVVAKLPQGDWLWPEIWMMPESSNYGVWPLSGEIDIMQSRGNQRHKGADGRETYSSGLHWGPSVAQDQSWRTSQKRTIKRTDFTEGFHTYGLEWSQDYLFTYIDNKLQTVLYVDFSKQNLWERGQFAGKSENGSALVNPWYQSKNNNAPFDQSFYLILNVAVGSRNGWFPDGLNNNKPWVNGRDSAPADFHAAQSQWLPTWGKGNDRGMTVKSVKMWQEGKCA